MPQPHFTPEKEPVPILQGAEWGPGPVWMGGKSRPHREMNSCNFYILQDAITALTTDNSWVTAGEYKQRAHKLSLMIA